MSETKPNPQVAVLRGCPNQKVSQMTVCTPWSFTPKIPAEARRDKPAFRTWGAETTTEHLFYSASEGINGELRVNKTTNPLKKLSGLIADYDSSIASSVIDEQLKEWSGENQPNWVSRTFSDGARVVWLFEQPLPMDNPNLVKPFLKIAAEELRAEKLLPGWDKPAWNDLARIYEVGRDWRAVGQSPLPTNRLYDILMRAASKVRWAAEGMAIPLEIIAEEVDRKFPGRWEGAFEEGKRGVVFFDPSASNPTSAIVTPAGMVCFSQEKIFYTWRDIFGPEFVRKFEEDRIGAAASEAWYDGNRYWLKSAHGVWHDHSKDDFVMRLKVQHGLNASREGRATCSEVERVLMFVQEQRRVQGAVPSIYNPEDTVTINGRRFVNSSAVRVVQPADVRQTWGDNFPWLAEFLDTCWDEQLVPCVVEDKPAQPAKEIFLAWFKRLYLTALQGNLHKGHSLFLVGKVATGKTLLGTRIVAGGMGGGAEAADFLLSSSHFNKELAHVGIWNIDDGSVNCDQRSQQKFAEMIKRAVANPNMSYHAKHQDQQRVEWHGRIIVTLNDDASSLGMIPNIDTGLQDKVIVLKFSDKKRDFPPKAQLEGTIQAELPYFSRWMLDYDVPAGLIGEPRFGINAYIHEETRVAALHSGGVRDVLEIVELWIQTSAPLEKYGEVWEGTASAWLSKVGMLDSLRPLVSKYTPRLLGRKFTEASKIRDSGIELVQSGYKGNGHRYRIRLDRDIEPGRIFRFVPETCVA